MKNLYLWMQGKWYEIVGVQWIHPPDECLEVPSIPIVIVEPE